MSVTQPASRGAGDDNTPLAAKLWRLRRRHGYFTRAELGESPPRRDPDAPWPVYDVMTLGLVPHPRETCASCKAVGR